mgnify:CR=1 FL=1
MTTQEIADKLVEMNRQDLHMEIYEALYDENVVSVERTGEGREDTGFADIKAKGDEWFAMIGETHALEVSDPLVADMSFAVTFTMDVTFKPGAMPGMVCRQKFTELATYHVNEAGKITRETFAYPIG